jgi:hypothetical protein
MICRDSISLAFRGIKTSCRQLKCVSNVINIRGNSVGNLTDKFNIQSLAVVATHGPSCDLQLHVMSVEQYFGDSRFLERVRTE